MKYPFRAFLTSCTTYGRVQLIFSLGSAHPAGCKRLSCKSFPASITKLPFKICLALLSSQQILHPAAKAEDLKSLSVTVPENTRHSGRTCAIIITLRITEAAFAGISPMGTQQRTPQPLHRPRLISGSWRCILSIFI